MQPRADAFANNPPTPWTQTSDSRSNNKPNNNKQHANRTKHQPHKQDYAQYATVDDAVQMVVGNKVDLDGAGLREVTSEEGAAFARRHGCLYKETSAKARAAACVCVRACWGGAGHLASAAGLVAASGLCCACVLACGLAGRGGPRSRGRASESAAGRQPRPPLLSP